MNARSARAFAAALAVLAILVVWRSHRGNADLHADERSPAAASQPPATSPGNAAVAADATDHPAAPARELIARDPEAAARLWRAHARVVLRAKNTKEYGEDIARLLELPFDEAWGQLVEKAKTDARAAMAASRIQGICIGEATRGEPHQREIPASSFYKNLPDAMKPFIDRIAEQGTEEYEQRVARCSGIPAGVDVWMAALDAYMRPENVDAQVQVAGENPDTREAIADLRAIVSKHDSIHARFALGDLLMQSDDAAERNEGRAMLEQVAPGNVDVANRLAYCLQNGCGNSEPDRTAAMSWLETSAGLGDGLGLPGIEYALTQNGDKAGAWAWSLYALDLALDGCFETFHPSHRSIALAAQTETERQAGLTPAEQNAGLAISYAIEGRWGKQARERLACD